MPEHILLGICQTIYIPIFRSFGSHLWWQTQKTAKYHNFFYLENRFMGQKYLQTASKVNMPLINLVGHMPKYIYTNFQVIWFTFVATNSKNSQIRQLFYLENQCLWPQMWTKWLANWYRYTLAYAQQDLLVAFLILRLFAGTSGP